MTPRMADLWGAFEHLTPYQKRVVFSMYWDGDTQEACAERLGVSRQSVTQALAAAGRTYEKILEIRIAKKAKRRLVHVETADEGAERGNGQRPDTYKAPASHGPPASLCPQPDTHYETPERDAFVKEISWIAASPFLQLQGRGNYNERARLNRERIARDQAAEREERRALQAA
jgi:predicted DNA-binding protein YlxM (UPF0122 family)